MLHVVAIVLALLLPVRVAPRVTFVQLPPEEVAGDAVTPFGASRRAGGPAPGTRAGRPAPPAVPARPDTIRPEAPAPGPLVAAVEPGARAAPAGGPRVGDGRLWVSPRPALPADVAARLYGDTLARDSAAVGRLRAMVDSLNEVIDAEQRAHRLPTWTTEIAGRTVGIDSQYIHIAGIKIPTLVLALLPISLPQGNYDEMQRAKQLQLMRDDLLRAAQRTQTLEDFRRYVKELRARKQAERDAERRQRGDTVKAVP